MQLPKRSTVLAVMAILLISLVGVWWYFGFSIDFMRFFAADPGVTNQNNQQTTVNPDQTPSGMVSCSPSKNSVSVNEAVSITGSGGAGTAYQWFAPGGTIAMPDNNSGSVDGSDTISVVYGTPGIKKITIQGARANSNTNLIDSVACTVTVTAGVILN